MRPSPAPPEPLDVPQQLQQERERATELHALNDVRAQIAARLQATQGAFQHTSARARFWPLALASVAAFAVVPMALRGPLSVTSGAAVLALSG